MSQLELQASYANEIDRLRIAISATEVLTDLSEAAAAKTAEELEDVRAVLQGMEKQTANTKKK